MISEEIKRIDNLEDLLKVANKTIDIDVLVNHEGAAKKNSKIMLKNYIYSLIVEKKAELFSKNLSQINIKRLLKRKCIKRKQLWSIFERYPYMERNLGNIPKIFLNKENNNNKEFAKKIYDLFAKYSIILNYDFTHPNCEDYVAVNCLVKDFERDFKDLIQKDVKVTFAGNGFFGNGYKISVKDGEKKQDFFYKVFYPHDKRSKHGADVEIMYAYFANHNGRKRQFAKFYMGRLATPFEKDAFILTEFIERKFFGVPQIRKNVLSLDYIVSLDKRIDNTINGTTVDFGDIKEFAPELNDRTLRKLVRLILIRSKITVDEKKLIFNWQINKENCNSLMNSIKQFSDKQFKEAIEIISKYVQVLPEFYIDKIAKLKKRKRASEISITKAMETKDLITRDLRKLLRNIRDLNLTIKSSLDAQGMSFGYIILDLFQNRQAVYILGKDNEITRVRLEKLVGDKFVTFIELFGDDIDKYENPDITKLICSVE